MIKFEHVVLPSPEQMEFDIEGVRNEFRSWDRMDSGKCAEVGCNDKCPYFVKGKTDDDNDCSMSDFLLTNWNEYILGPNDSKLCKSLAYAGAEHRKFMRSMQIRVRVTAPLYWWKEYDTYKIGTVTESESTMHTIAQREFRLDDFSHEHLVSCGVATRHDKDKNLTEEKIGELGYDYYGALMAVIYSLNSAREQYLSHKAMKRGNIAKQYWWQMIQLLPSSYNQTRNITLSYEAAANIYRQRKYHKLNEWREFCSFLETLPYPEFIVGKDCSTTVLCGDNKQTVVTQSADEIRIGTIPANKVKVHDAMLLKKGDTIC